ncbi:hypothetical protein Trydic_g576 [Trypoxylus dichotomus]
MMHISSIAALQALPILTPFHICIQKGSTTSALTHNSLKALQAGYLRGDLKLLRESNINNLPYIAKHVNPMQYNFGQLCKVVWLISTQKEDRSTVDKWIRNMSRNWRSHLRL